MRLHLLAAAVSAAVLPLCTTHAASLSCHLTPSAAMGPFFQTQGVAVRDGVACAPPHTPAIAPRLLTPLTVVGSVRDEECGVMLPAALVDVWQADANGDYDPINSNDNDNYCRATLQAGDDGEWSFSSVLPGAYAFSAGGTTLPRHIHFRIRHEGYQDLVTQLFFELDRDLAGPGDNCGSEAQCNAQHDLLRSKLRNVTRASVEPANMVPHNQGWTLLAEFHVVLRRQSGFSPPADWPAAENTVISPDDGGGIVEDDGEGDDNGAGGDGGNEGEGDGADDGEADNHGAGMCEVLTPVSGGGALEVDLVNCSLVDDDGNVAGQQEGPETDGAPTTTGSVAFVIAALAGAAAIGRAVAVPV